VAGPAADSVSQARVRVCWPRTNDGCDSASEVAFFLLPFSAACIILRGRAAAVVPLFLRRGSLAWVTSSHPRIKIKKRPSQTLNRTQEPS